MVFYTDEELINMNTEELRSICICYELPHTGRKHELIYLIIHLRNTTSVWNW